MTKTTTAGLLLNFSDDEADIRRKSKFELYYDDSSSEEEEREVFESYNNEALDWGVEKTKENLMRECKHFYRKDKDNVAFNQNLKLSFIIHEAAVNLIKSPKIGEIFFPLKSRFLENNNVLSKSQLKNICIQSINKTLENHKKTATAKDINDFADHLVSNERNLLKAINSGDLTYFYSYKNPLHLKVKTKTTITREKLKNEILKLCQQPALPEDHQLTRKVTSEAQVINYNKVYLSEPNTELCKFLKYKLLNLKVQTTLKSFIDQTMKSSDLKNAIDTTQQKFRANLASEVKENLRKENKNEVTRATLPKYFDYEIKKDWYGTPSDKLIAVGRLMTTSLKRTYKNEEGKESLLDSSQSSFFRKISLTKVDLMETQLLYKTTGARTDYVDIETQGKGGAYKNIALTIESIKNKLKIKDSEIAQWVQKTLKGQTNIFPKDYTSKQKLELQEFIPALTYLLFGTEAVRNPASLIIHQMMLELIISDQEGKWTFSNAFISENGKVSGGKMPMSQKRIDKPDIGAVDVARFMHNKIFQTTMKYSYDKSPIEPSFSNKTKAYDFLIKMINLEAEIITDWLSLKRKNINDSFELYKVLLKGCEQWYEIVPMRQLIVDTNTIEFDYSEEDIEYIFSLPVKKLITLREIIDQHDNEVECLLKYGASIRKIIAIYENDPKLLKDAANREALNIIRDQEWLQNDELIECILKYGATTINENYQEYLHSKTREQSYCDWLDENGDGDDESSENDDNSSAEQSAEEDNNESVDNDSRYESGEGDEESSEDRSLIGASSGDSDSDA